ncbi:hypothetical protein FKW77_010793 [Venturia effusa]|uniref:Uncharacterized protein n=1 Tax=Venturia effusa TaxID=50376 RepID=A0A517KYG8_9PEZI|nr:hypothetical protein FKW77_010793 [Venturia effusa]
MVQHPIRMHEQDDYSKIRVLDFQDKVHRYFVIPATIDKVADDGKTLFGLLMNNGQICERFLLFATVTPLNSDTLQFPISSFDPTLMSFPIPESDRFANLPQTGSSNCPQRPLSPAVDKEAEPMERVMVMCSKKPALKSLVAGKTEGWPVSLSLLSPSSTVSSLSMDKLVHKPAHSLPTSSEPSSQRALSPTRGYRHPPRKDIYDGPDDEDDIHETKLFLDAADEVLEQTTTAPDVINLPLSRIEREATPYHGSDASLHSESESEQELGSPMRLRSRSRRQNPYTLNSSQAQRNQGLEGGLVSDLEGIRTPEEQPVLLFPIMRTAGLEYFCPEVDCHRHSSGGQYGWKKPRYLVNHLRRKHPEIHENVYEVQSLDDYMHRTEASQISTSAINADHFHGSDPPTLTNHGAMEQAIPTDQSAPIWQNYQESSYPGEEALIGLLYKQNSSGESGYFCPLEECSGQDGYPESKPWQDISSLKHHLAKDHYGIPIESSPSNLQYESTSDTIKPAEPQSLDVSENAYASANLSTSATTIINESISNNNIIVLTTTPDNSSVFVQGAATEARHEETNEVQPTATIINTIATTREGEVALEKPQSDDELAADIERRHRELLERVKAAKKADEEAEAAEQLRALKQKQRAEEHAKHLANNELKKKEERDKLARLLTQDRLAKMQMISKMEADLARRDELRCIAKAERERAEKEAEEKMKREREDDEREVQEVKRRRLDKERQIEREAVEAAAFLTQEGGV